MEFQKEFFLDEVIDGFYVPGLMKRAWAAELQLLSFLDEFCEKKGISYFLDYGSLLGAVRHKGFIPWDDDMDISMYRKDFRVLEASIEEELPEEIAFYYVGKDRETASSMAAIGMKEPGLDPEKQAFFQQFPFYAGLDIVILEDVLEEECEKKRQSIFRYLASLLKSVEGEKELKYDIVYKKWQKDIQRISEEISSFIQCYGGEVPLLFPKDGKSIIGEIYFAMDSLYRCLRDWETEDVACGPDYALQRKGKIKRNWYQGRERKKLSFCGNKFTAPYNWPGILKEEYGNYQIAKPNLGDHRYPYYRRAEESFLESLGEENPYRYFFSKEDLEKQDRKNLRSIILESFTALEGKWREALTQEISGIELMSLCEKSQEEALAIGNAIESRGSLPSVALLEEFCSLVYKIYEALGNGNYAPAESTGRVDPAQERKEQNFSKAEINLHQILNILQDAKIQFCKDWKVRVVFLAYSFTRFEESLAKEFCNLQQEGSLDLFLLPVPYGFKNVRGELREKIYEGERFENKYPILHYESVNLQSLQADIIVTPTAFDHVNPVFSLDPYYDTKQIKVFTPNLVYYPDFTLERTKEEEYKAIYNRRYYIPLPGIAHCDFSIFSKDEIVEEYLQYWKTKIFAKEESESCEELLKNKLISIEQFGNSHEPEEGKSRISQLFSAIVDRKKSV